MLMQRMNEKGEIVEEVTPTRYVERTGPRDIECDLVSVDYTGSGATGEGAWIVCFNEKTYGHMTAVYFREYDEEGIRPVISDEHHLAILPKTKSGLFLRSDYFVGWIECVVAAESEVSE